MANQGASSSQSKAKAVFALNKPAKLSAIRHTQDAIDFIADFMIVAHQAMANPLPTTHFAFEGYHTDTLWSVLLAYVDGAAVVDWIKPTDALEPNFNFNFNFDMIKNFFEAMIDVDLDEDTLQQLPLEHPFWLLPKLNKLRHLEASGVQDDTLRQETVVQFTNFLQTVLGKIREKHPAGIHIHDNYHIASITDVIKIESDADQKIIPANYLMRETNKGIDVVSLEAPRITVDDPERATAFSMHQLMMAAAKYHDIILKSMHDFLHAKESTELARDADHLFARIQSKRPHLADENRPKVTIVGLGPAGLFSAIRDYEAGAKIVAVEKRLDYSRNNVFRLTSDAADKLIGLFVDNVSDIANLSPSHPLRVILDTKSLTPRTPSRLGDFYAISTKDFEYLANVWLELVAKKDPDGLKIYRGYGYVSNSMDAKPKTIYIRPTDHPNKSSTLEPNDIEIPTEILIAADGYGSQCRQDCGIGVQANSTSHPYATFTYHTPRADETEFFKSLVQGKVEREKSFNISILKAQGWEKDTLPIARYFSTGDHPYLGIEVPEILAENYRLLTEEANSAKRRGEFEGYSALIDKRDQLLDDWGRATMQMFLPKAEVDQMIIKRHALFPTQLQRAETPAIRAAGGIEVMVIGDALQSAHFQTGQGAIVAIAEAELCAECIESTLKGKPVDTIRAKFIKDMHKSTLGLHELAFHFPTGEHLQVTPTSSFVSFRADTRAEILSDNSRALTTETKREAEIKGRAKQRR